jgi:SAM-dependent methyltransferase
VPNHINVRAAHRELNHQIAPATGSPSASARERASVSANHDASSAEAAEGTAALVERLDVMHGLCAVPEAHAIRIPCWASCGPLPVVSSRADLTVSLEEGSVPMPQTGGSNDEGAQREPFELNTNVAQSARVYDYWLGGKDNFPADRGLGDAIADQVPTIRTQVRGQRAFLGRAVRYLAGEAGIRQFLDIGTGIPTAGNVHDVAQKLAPESRVLYVDNDPIVLAHSRALVPSSPKGRVAFILADLRDPEAVLADPALAETLNLTEPVGLVLIGIMPHLRDADDPRRIVTTLVDALASGSYLVLSQTTPDFDPEAMRGLAEVSERGGIPNVPRTLADTEPFFAGLELVEPGLVPLAAWRPDPGTQEDPRSVYAYGAVARKP